MAHTFVKLRTDHSELETALDEACQLCQTFPGLEKLLNQTNPKSLIGVSETHREDSLEPLCAGELVVKLVPSSRFLDILNEYKNKKEENHAREESQSGQG